MNLLLDEPIVRPAPNSEMAALNAANSPRPNEWHILWPQSEPPAPLPDLGKLEGLQLLLGRVLCLLDPEPSLTPFGLHLPVTDRMHATGGLRSDPLRPSGAVVVRSADPAFPVGTRAVLRPYSGVRFGRLCEIEGLALLGVPIFGRAEDDILATFQADGWRLNPNWIAGHLQTDGTLIARANGRGRYVVSLHGSDCFGEVPLLFSRTCPWGPQVLFLPATPDRLLAQLQEVP